MRLVNLNVRERDQVHIDVYLGVDFKCQPQISLPYLLMQRLSLRPGT